MNLGNFELTRIGLGSNRLTNTPENQAFLREAVAAGVNFIDTARLYTGGESERTIGAALGSAGSSPPGCVIATKGGYHSGRPEVLRGELEASLRALQRDTIDLYYLHRVDHEIGIETSLGVIQDCREAGKVRHVGVSNVDVAQLERALDVVPIASVQNHYNLGERGSDDVVDYCAERGIAFAPYFPLRDQSRPELDEIAAAHEATPAQITLAWLLKRAPTTLPIPGTLSIEHVRENLAALEIELTDEEFQALAV